jgi:PucR C-terminal helix-turn-helix domain/GGDEF-like domain
MRTILATPQPVQPCAGGHSRAAGDCARALRTRPRNSYAPGMTRQTSARPDPAPPAVAAIGERLLHRVEDLASELTEVIRRDEPFYQQGGLVPAEDLRDSVRDNLAHILGRLSGHPLPGLQPPRVTGRRRAEQGVPLPPILHAYRVAGRFIWAAILAEAAGDEVATTALLHAGSELWLLIDDYSSSVTEAYRDALAERAHSDSQTRNAMLDVLLRGDTGDGSRLWDSATTLRLPHHGTFVVVAARPPRPGVEAVPHAEDVLRVRGIRSAWRVELDAHIGIVVLSARTGIDKLRDQVAELATGPVGFSEPYRSLDQTPAALRQARLAAAAATPDSRDLVRYGQVPIPVLLASAPDAAAMVARSILGPVLALPAAECDVLLDTVRVWFAEQGATSVAAERLHVHRNTVRYRLRRLEELTGRSLTQPIGVAELYLALEAARMLRVRGAAG